VRSWGFTRKSGRASGSSGPQWRLDVEQCFGLPQAPGPERLDAGFGKNRTYCVSHVVLVCGYNSVGYHRAAIASRRKVATPREGASTSGPPKGSVLRIPPSLLPWADPRDCGADEKGSLIHPTIAGRPSPDIQTR
jgi:hypothetical protein